MKLSKNSIRILYRSGKITKEGVKRALYRGWITVKEYEDITGEKVK